MINSYICALDIGSSKLAAVLAKIRKNSVTDLFFETEVSRGIKEGTIVDSIELIGCIERVLKNLKAKSGVKIKSVFTNISGHDLLTKHSCAVIPLAERGNKVIANADIQRVNEQARVLGSNLEEEIIHQIPYSYNIDSKKNITNPLGLYSHRLEVDLFLVSVKVSSLQALTRVINQAGYELKDLFFSGVATSSAIIGEDFKTGRNIFCDIGSDITEVLNFKDGLIRQSKILHCGGDNLTRGLSRELNISFDLAEDVKRSYVTIGDYEFVQEDKEILVKKDSLYKPIKQKAAARVATSEAKFICDGIQEAIKEMVPLNEVDNFIVTGRSVLLEGFLELLESNLGVSVKMGKIADPKISGLANKKEDLAGHKHLTYLTALGVISETMRNTQALSQFSPLSKTIRRPLFRITDRIREVYQEYF